MSAPTLSKEARQRLAAFSRGYSAHRPMIQRGLNIGFVLYVVGGTYYGMAKKPSNAPSTRKGRGKKGSDPNQPERVAVRDPVLRQRWC